MSDSSATLLYPRRWRREMPFMLAVALAALALYAYTAPRTVALEDDAIFIGTLHFFGLPHPPGYPLHTLLGGALYHLLPFGTPAYKAHLVSAIFAALACSAVYAITALLTPGRLTALLAALLFAVSEAFWSQAIIAEVYSLNALLFFVFVALCLHYHLHGSRATVWLIAFVGGLGLANHYPLFILAASGITLYLFLHLPDKIRLLSIGTLISIATAALFYLWMVLRSHDTTLPAHFFGLPLNNLHDFLHYLLRENYRGVDNTAGVTWQDKLAALKFLGGETLRQFTPVGALLAASGFYFLWRRQWQITLALLAAIFGVSILLIGVRDFKVSYIDLSVFRVYHLTSYGILAIAAAVAVQTLTQRLFLQRNRQKVVAAVSAAVLILATLSMHWQQNNRRDYRWAEDTARAKLNSVDPSAFVFVQHDFDAPIGYLHTVLGERPDITLLHINGLIYGNHLYNPDTPLDAPAGEVSKKAILNRLANNTNRPIFYAPELAHIFEDNGRHYDLLGFYKRLNRLPHNRILLQPFLYDWLIQTTALHPTDRWSYLQKNGLTLQIAAVMLAAHWGGQSLPPAVLAAINEARQDNIEIDMMMTEHELAERQLTAAETEEKLRQCREPPRQIRHESDDIGKSNFYLLCARLAWHRDGADGADGADGETYLQQALLHPALASRAALTTAITHYQQLGDACRATTLAQTLEREYGDTQHSETLEAIIARARAECNPPSETSSH